jgi:hypothetical protein
MPVTETRRAMVAMSHNLAFDVHGTLIGMGGGGVRAVRLPGRRRAGRRLTHRLGAGLRKPAALSPGRIGPTCTPRSLRALAAALRTR